MLKVQLLNSEASLNDFFPVVAVNFIPGQNLTIAMQLMDAERNIRYIPPLAAILSLSFVNKDDTTLDVTATLIDADDRSMWNVSLSTAQTTLLAGQNIIVTLDVNGDASDIQKALVANAIIRNNLSGDC